MTHGEREDRRGASLSALRTALVYLVFAVLWILLSDRAIHFLFAEDPARLEAASMAKGVAFVLLTALLLYVAVRRQVLRALASRSREKALGDLLTIAERAAQAGAWSWNMITDEHHWSPQLLRLFGFDPATRVTFGTWATVLHPDDRDESTRLFMDCIPNHQPFFHTYRVVLPDGLMRWIEASGQVSYDESGRPVRFSGLCVDVTARMRVEAELEQHRKHLEQLVEERTSQVRQLERQAQLLLEASADGLMGMDEHGNCTFINPAACSMLGFAPADLLGRNLHALTHARRPDGSDYPAADCPIRRSLHQGEVVRVSDEVFWRADGQPLPVLYSSHPLVEDGRIKGTVVSFTDASEIRAAAEAKEQALVAAERLATMRQQMLANVSHELRTPLNGIIGMAEIARRRIDDRERVMDALSKIREAGRQLTRLVSDILDFSALEKGSYTVEQQALSPRELVGQALDKVRNLAVSKGLELKMDVAPDVPDVILGDAARLSNVLSHLVANAVKFTLAGEVSVTAVRDADQLVLRVRDTGVGIEEKRMSELFEPFHQLDGSTTRAYGGAGLGLAICRRVVELMRGTIEVESTLGKQTVFEIRIPCVAPDTALAATPSCGELPAAEAEGKRSDPQALQPLFARLEPLLEGYDIASRHLVLDNEALLRGVLGSAFGRFKAAVDDFEYEAALEILRRARQELAVELLSAAAREQVPEQVGQPVRPDATVR